MRLNAWAGFLISYSAVFMALTVSEMPIITVMLILGVLFILVAEGRFNRDRAYDLICFVALANVAWQIMQYFGVFILNLPMHGYEFSHVGLMSNRNETAALLATCLPCFFRKRWACFLPVMLTGIFLANSYGGILASSIVCSLFVVMTMNRKRALLLVVVSVLCMAFFLFYVRPIKNAGPLLKSERLIADVVSLDTWRYQTMGWGIGQFKYVFPLVSSFNHLSPDEAKQHISLTHNQNALKALLENKKKISPTYFSVDRMPEVFTELHNEYLEWLFNAGWIGFVLLSGGLLSVLYCGLRLGSLAAYGLLASCLSALWFFPWHIIPTAFITTLYVGDITNQWRSSRCK